MVVTDSEVKTTEFKFFTLKKILINFNMESKLLAFLWYQKSVNSLFLRGVTSSTMRLCISSTLCRCSHINFVQNRVYERGDHFPFPLSEFSSCPCLFMCMHNICSTMSNKDMYIVDAYSKAISCDHKEITSSASSQYRTYLKSVYKSSPVSPENKWPPTPSKEYIRLAVAKKEQKCRDQYIGYTLRGEVHQALLGRENILVEQLFEPVREFGVMQRKTVRLVIVEGAPGIGKSTLSWELCRKWEELSCTKHYNLVILLRLREEEVQNIASISELLHDCQDKGALADEVTRSQGKDVLFILDGFDELPKALQKKSYLLDLISGRVLPESTVLVTSRPSATAELLTSCRPMVDKHVEILGFTQESVDAYAKSIFSEPEKLAKFQSYISASQNPAINSLMYIPLNAAIVVEIFNSSSNSDSLLPHTLTELYTQLCLTVLNRHIQNVCDSESFRVSRFEDLSSDSYDHFLRLSRLAFEGMQKGEIIFHNLPLPFIHFGFLDAVSALYGGGGVSYNFLHLTVQEFFAAYHISRLGNDMLDVFQLYGGDKRWHVVWRFVAGFTKIKHFVLVDHCCFIAKTDKSEDKLTIFLAQCLFEAQTAQFSDYDKMVVDCNQVHNAYDMYALGYCIANCLPGVTVSVKLYMSDVNSFIFGLKKYSSLCGTIDKLDLERIYSWNVVEMKKCSMLYKLEAFSLTYCNLTDAHLQQLANFILCIQSLKSFIFQHNFLRPNCATKLFHALLNSDLTTFNLTIDDYAFSEHDHSAIEKLFSGKLEELTLCDRSNNHDLMRLLATTALLKTLCVSSSAIDALSYLERNTSVTSLELDFYLDHAIPEVCEILECNKTLECVKLYQFNGGDNLCFVGPFNNALRMNTTLQCLEVYVHLSRDHEQRHTHGYVRDYIKSKYKNLKLDHRIEWLLSPSHMKQTHRRSKPFKRK